MSGRVERVYRIASGTFMASVAVAAVGTFVIGGVSSPPSSPQAAAGVQELPAEVRVSSDADSIALFSAAAMAPGKPVRNCTTVRYDGAGAGHVMLSATASSLELAPHLEMTVEVGPGGAAGTCADFEGTTAYAGTLAGFATDHRDAAGGLPLLTVDGVSGSTSMRLTFILADSAPQGRSATAAFHWTARTADRPPVTTAPPTAAPAPDSAETATADRGTPRSESPVPVAPSPAGSAPAASDTEPARPSTPGLIDRLSAAVTEVVDQAVETAVLIAGPAARASVVPTGLSIITALFVVAQNRIDRHDPKLALAPVSHDDREFVDRESTP